jgi:uncharacterized protein
MRFHQDTSSGNSIQSYSERGIVIDDKLITRSVLVTPDTVREWTPRCVTDLGKEHFAEIAALQPGIVILGTGATLVFPPAQLLVGLQNQGIGVEVMANDAAIRTFNVLLSEDRRALLALLQNPVSI